MTSGFRGWLLLLAQALESVSCELRVLFVFVFGASALWCWRLGCAS